jgi:hypothetical protein
MCRLTKTFSPKDTFIFKHVFSASFAGGVNDLNKENLNLFHTSTVDITGISMNTNLQRQPEAAKTKAARLKSDFFFN